MHHKIICVLLPLQSNCLLAVFSVSSQKVAFIYRYSLRLHLAVLRTEARQYHRHSRSLYCNHSNVHRSSKLWYGPGPSSRRYVILIIHRQILILLIQQNQGYVVFQKQYNRAYPMEQTQGQRHHPFV